MPVKHEGGEAMSRGPMSVSPTCSRSRLKADGIFLTLAGGAAMVIETVGHFRGVGPLAQTLHSPYTIGSFEAHGLAILFALLFFRAARGEDRRYWHGVGIAVHSLLGGSNLLYWSSFVDLALVPMGVITTVLHVVFVGGHVICRRQ